MQAVIFIGIQATGKSTFFKERFVDTHLRLNLDMLKTRHRESILLRACLEAKQSFVVDNTNPSKEERARYVGPARDARFEIVGYYFSSKVSEALERNARRRGAARLPDIAVMGTAGRLELPDYEEGFDALHYVEIVEDEFVVREWKIDGD